MCVWACFGVGVLKRDVLFIDQYCSLADFASVQFSLVLLNETFNAEELEDRNSIRFKNLEATLLRAVRSALFAVIISPHI